MFGTQKWPLGHFEVARGLARSRIALWELTSPIVINEPTRSALVLETGDLFASLVTHQKNKNNLNQPYHYCAQMHMIPRP